MDQVIIFGAKYLFLAVPALFIVMWAQTAKKQRSEQALSLFLTIILAGLMDKIAGKLFYSTRPFVAQNIEPLVKHAADNGFPSEHTLFCFAIATLIFLYKHNLGIAALIISSIVGISRVAAHVHSPIDILGGAIIGVVAGYCGYSAAKKFIPRKSATKSVTD